MMITAYMILMILAIVCLLLSALGVSAPRGNLMAAGLMFWAIATAISR